MLRACNGLRCKCAVGFPYGHWTVTIAPIAEVGNVLTTKLGVKIVRKGIPTQRSFHSYNCGQTVRWMKMPLGKEVGLGPGHIVLDPVGSQLSTAAFPHFSAHVYCGQTVAHLSSC